MSHASKLVALYLALLIAMLIVAYALRAAGLSLPDLQTAVPLPATIDGPRPVIDESLWAVPDDLQPIRFRNQAALAAQCKDGALACLIDNGEAFQQERLDWVRRIVSQGAMFCLTFAPVPDNAATLSHGVRFFVSVEDDEQPARLTAQISHTSDLTRARGEHAAVEFSVVKWESKACSTLMVREPVTIHGITIFPAIGYAGFTSEASGRLDVVEMDYRELGR